MTPSGDGRVCDHCQKTVIDFTTWSDAALYQYFSKDTERTCGRFLATQVDRPIHLPHQPHSRLYRMTIALGLTLLFTQTHHLLAQSRPPTTVQTQTNQKPDSTAPPSFGDIRGQLWDNKKEFLISAVVQIFQNGVFKGGAVTDFDGFYTIKPLEPGFYDVVAIYPGFDTVRVNRVIATPGNYTTVNIEMKAPVGKFPESYVVKHYRTGLINRMEPHTNTINNEELYHPTQIDIDFPKKDAAKPETESPTKRTFRREEINQMPH